MTVDELITAAITFYDNISTTDGGYGQRRARTLLYLQQVYDEIRHHREWHWETYAKEGTIPANQSWLLLPDDYEEFGTGGGFFVAASSTPTDGDYVRVTEQSIQQVSDLLRTRLGPNQLPRVFAIYANPDSELPAVNFPPSSSIIGYKFIYSRAPLILEDGVDQDFILPIRYHHSVLLPGVVARMQESKGDARTDWRQQYERGLAEMVKRERPRKTETQQIPASVDPFYC